MNGQREKNGKKQRHSEPCAEGAVAFCEGSLKSRKRQEARLDESKSKDGEGQEEAVAEKGSETVL